MRKLRVTFWSSSAHRCSRVQPDGTAALRRAPALAELRQALTPLQKWLWTRCCTGASGLPSRNATSTPFRACVVGAEEGSRRQHLRMFNAEKWSPQSRPHRQTRADAGSGVRSARKTMRNRLLGNRGSGATKTSLQVTLNLMLG